MRGSRKTSCDGLPSQPKRQYLLSFTNDPIIIIWFNLKLNLGRTQKIEEKKSSQKTFYFNFFCVIIEMLWCRGWWCYHLYQLHTSLRGSITRGILDAFNKMLLRYFYRLLFTLRKAKTNVRIIDTSLWSSEYFFSAQGWEFTADFILSEVANSKNNNYNYLKVYLPRTNNVLCCC